MNKNIIADIGLVACAKKKRDQASRAKDLYISALFDKDRQFVSKYCRKWFILSAKHRLLDPNKIVEPYDQTLNQMSRIERKNWSIDVFQKLKNHLNEGDKIIILAGTSYREYLAPVLIQEGYDLQIPLDRKSIGVQLKWLNLVNNNPERIFDLQRFYELLTKLEEGLGGKRILRECSGELEWPKRGVYFFYEPGEIRALDKNQSRVVRVGTHMVSRDSKSTLWNRLRTHRGTDDGKGNHRGSIFRLYLGLAIINKNNIQQKYPTWGVGSNASSEIREAESAIEKEVSEYLGKMSVLWLNISDGPGPISDRAYIERNSIALLSGACRPIDMPSQNWLGYYCPNQNVSNSSLWNVDFTDLQYDRRFLDIFEHYVNVTIGIVAEPKSSIAPTDWYVKNPVQNACQLKLSF